MELVVYFCLLAQVRRTELFFVEVEKTALFYSLRVLLTRDSAFSALRMRVLIGQVVVHCIVFESRNRLALERTRPRGRAGFLIRLWYNIW